MRWIRALHIRERHIAALLSREKERDERLHRLEIAQRQLLERLEYLEASQERLLARFKGTKGGRPPTPTNPLATIPHGDKNALRAVLMPGHRPTKPTGSEDAA